MSFIRRLNSGVVLLMVLAGGAAAETESGIPVGQGDQASVVMQLVPGEVYNGERFNAVMQIKNVGSTTWSRAGGYYLAPVSSAGWPTGRLELDNDARIAPGASATFKAAFIAPEGGGKYTFQWRMRHNGTAFGEATAPVELEIERRTLSRDDAEFVFQDVSQVMLAGEPQTVAIQFKNTGRTAWRAGRVDLTSPDGNGLVWAVDSVGLGPDEVVEPGGFVVFHFKLQAPSEPGHYPFQWQLHHVRDGLFGQPSEALIIDVR